MQRSSGFGMSAYLLFTSGNKVKLGGIWLFVADGEVLSILGEK